MKSKKILLLFILFFTGVSANPSSSDKTQEYMNEVQRKIKNNWHP